MKRLMLALSCSLLAASAAAQEARFFEMRTYHASPGKLEAVQELFQRHSSRLLEKHRIEVIGYWLPLTPQGQTDDRMICVLAYPDRAAREERWKALVSDPEWRATHYRAETESQVIAKIENLFLTPTDYSPAPQPSSKAEPRIFELRTYKAAPGKHEGLMSRFRDHTVRLFARHGMTNLVYWTPADKEKGADDTIIYILAHDSREAAAASFKGFRGDPDWLEARKASEAGGSLTTRVESVFMKPTAFSPIR